MSREPDPVYFGCIQNTDWTWADYFSIHQRARIHGSVKVIFYAVAIDPSNNWWSPWFKLFLFRYLPRAKSIFDRTFDEFVRIFHWEMHVAVQNDFVLEFEFIHKHTIVIPNEEDESFKLSVRFRGLISVDPHDRPTFMFTFPFFCCTRDVAPYWLNESIPYEVLAPNNEELIEELIEQDRNRLGHNNPAVPDTHAHDYEDRANSD